MLIVGTGAVATLLAEQFFQAGLSFQIFGGLSERLQALESRFAGSTVSSPKQIQERSRWVVAVKTGQNLEKIQLLTRAPAPESLLILQNGLNPEQEWRRLTPEVERGVSTYGVRTVRPGAVAGGGRGCLTLPTGSGFAETLRLAGFEVLEVENMATVIWQKLAVNASLNVVATLYGVTNGRILDIPEALESVRRASLEVARVATAVGVDFGPRSAWELTREVALGTSDNVCSTLADLRSGRPTEYQAINGEVLRYAQRLGVAVPTLHKLDHEFRALLSSPVEAA